MALLSQADLVIPCGERDRQRGWPNGSLRRTLSRTTMTSFTTALTLIVLFFMGGAMIHGFATALLFGIAIGTYSSVFVASALAVILGATRDDLMPTVVEKEGADSAPL